MRADAVTGWEMVSSWEVGFDLWDALTRDIGDGRLLYRELRDGEIDAEGILVRSPDHDGEIPADAAVYGAGLVHADVGIAPVVWVHGDAYRVEEVTFVNE